MCEELFDYHEAELVMRQCQDRLLRVQRELDAEKAMSAKLRETVEELTADLE